MAKEPTDRTQRPAGETTQAEKTREQELREAIERVYRAYGSDLRTFNRDVHRELVKRGGGSQAIA